MGVVYSANDIRLNRPVALKMILDPGNDEDGRKRFLREAQAAARVTHPNICRIYDIGEVDGRPFSSLWCDERGTVYVSRQRGAHMALMLAHINDLAKPAVPLWPPP